jgi:hypothetical protein
MVGDDHYARPGRLLIRADASTGLLGHDFRYPHASWTLPAQVVPNGRGVDTELATLERVLESR